MTNRSFTFIVYLCFFMSGAAGLIYEVVWARQLGLFLGITTYAHTAVITAFMTGLGLGSWLIGKYADKMSRPLRFYAWIEICIGIYALSTPWLFPILQVLYSSSSDIYSVTSSSGHTIRFTIAIAALLIPTFLMGGTLPLLIRGLVHALPDLASTTGKLYGINTLGATIGTFSTGFLLLPKLGIRETIFAGVFLNILVAILILYFDRTQNMNKVTNYISKTSKTSKQTISKDDTKGSQLGLEHNPLNNYLRITLLVGFTLAGFAAMLGQLAWIRSFILIVGSSVYAFALTLTGFLAGIGLGSVLFGYWTAKQTHIPTENKIKRAAILFIGIGFSILVSVITIHWTPEIYITGYKLGFPKEFIFYQASLFLIICLIVFFPSLGMGILFPLLASLLSKSLTNSGTSIGMAYALNTLGTIVGTLCGGLLILPFIGSQHTIYLAASIYIIAGIIIYLVDVGTQQTRMPILPALITVFALYSSIILLPEWRQSLMASGIFYNAQNYIQKESAEQSLDDLANKDKLLFHKEGIDTIVSVFESKRQRYLKVNGKTDASSIGDMPTQILLGQLPMLMHQSPKRVLIVGLGSGVTAAAVATHKDVESITILEISSEVIQASEYFKEVNNNVLSDPRVTLYTGDARNFLLADKSFYDVIITEPSNPWISGVSNLFTHEFFKILEQRLSQGGLITQWIQLYGMALDDLKTLLKTYHSVFSHLSLWSPLAGDTMVIGSNDTHSIQYSRLETAFTIKSQKQQFSLIDIVQPRDFIRKFLATTEHIEVLAANAPLNTDNNPRIEFNTPHHFFQATVGQNINAIINQQQAKYYQIPINAGIISFPDKTNIAAMGIQINTPLQLLDNLKFKWSIRQVYISHEDSKNDKHLASGTERTMTWKDNDNNTTNKLQSFHIPVTLPEDALQTHLDNVFSNDTYQRGQFTLQSNNTGWWGRQESDNGAILIALTWLCPTTRGTIRQTLISFYPKASPLELQLPALLSKYECI